MNLDEKIQAVKDELELIKEVYELNQKLQYENKIEQEKIIQQNLTLKHQREELAKSQQEVKTKETELENREKPIALREKTLLASNRLFDQKLEDFRVRNIKLAEGEAELRREKAEFDSKKQQVEKNILVNKDIELKLQKIKLKETQIDNELSRLKNMSA